MSNEIFIREPEISFSYFGDKVTITIDNTTGFYDKIIPVNFLKYDTIDDIDFKNGIRVVRRFEDIEESEYQRVLYDFIISREKMGTAINYV